MTPEESLKNLKYLISDACTDTQFDYIEEIETAIEALEKQIPKKPKAHIIDVDKLKIGNANWCKGTTAYHCPNCNNFISRTYNFCDNCGQKISWESDTND